MDVLYYSTAFHASHGGSIQSIEFFKSLNYLKAVGRTEIYPKHKSTSNISNKFKETLRRFLRSIPLLQVLFFYRKNQMYLRGLFNCIKEFRPDIVVVQIDSNFLQIEKIKEKFPELIITTQINASPFDEPFKNIAFKKYFLRKQKIIYSKADYNFFISDFLKKKIMDNYLDPRRDITVHNGTDIEKFKPLKDIHNLREKYSYPKKEFIIGYIGTLDFHKKVEVLIDSIGNLKEYNILLVIIGNGPSIDLLKEKTITSHLENKVIFKGWINHKYMNEHLNCFDLAIHHHANEYMSPLKIFEYLSAGLPVIAPDIPGVREILNNNVDVLYTQPTVSSITEKILQLYKDDHKRKQLANSGSLKIRNNYTWYNYADNIINSIKRKSGKI